MGTFSITLKNLRIQDKLSQQELADKLGVAKSTISMYENGNREPDLETLESIADFFNVDMNYLLGRTSQQINIMSAPEPTYDDLQYLIARNGKNLSNEEKMKLIKMISEL